MTAAKPKNSGQFGKGNPGKPKGATTHLNRDIKEMILSALAAAGGVQYLQEKAKTHPQAFLALVGKVLPLQLTGDASEPLIVKIMRPDV